MKLIFICFLTVGISIFNQTEENLIINNQKIELSLNSNVTKGDLKLFKEKLKKVNVKFTVQQAYYFPGGGLRSIKFKVRTKNDEYKGSAEHKFLTKFSKFGFRINLSPYAKSSIRVGKLD